MSKHSAQLGSISTGTLRSEDLLSAFASELEWLGNEDDKPLVFEANAMLEAEELDENEAADLVNDLIDALSEHAPPYCYFGAHEGDGADFGFWPSMESIDELPCIENVEGEDLPTEDHRYVNDHGNVTVYDGDHNVILELV